MKNLLSPSILSADFSNLLEGIKQTEKGGAHLLHIDVMDGHFVPNISIGPVILESLKGKTDMKLDIHLMIENPDLYIEKFIFPNTEYITVHAEACTHLHRTVQLIKSFGVKAGVALNPATPVSCLDYILSDIDMVLLMSVNPGFGGQSFITSALGKIQEVREKMHKNNLNVDIEIDGGVKLDNIKDIIDAGANVLVAGSAIFHAASVTEETRKFVHIIEKEDL